MWWQKKCINYLNELNYSFKLSIPMVDEMIKKKVLCKFWKYFFIAWLEPDTWPLLRCIFVHNNLQVWFLKYFTLSCPHKAISWRICYHCNYTHMEIIMYCKHSFKYHKHSSKGIKIPHLKFHIRRKWLEFYFYMILHLGHKLILKHHSSFNCTQS